MTLLVSPTIQDDLALKQRLLYREMETFANGFLAQHQSILARYYTQYCADPFHHWSRGWEYTWMHQRLYQFAISGCRFMEVGTGVTFFPFWVAEMLRPKELLCIDADPHAVTDMQRIAESRPAIMNVDMLFVVADMTRPHAFRDYDAAYSISVAEHTASLSMLAQMIEAIRGHGSIINTFDVPHMRWKGDPQDANQPLYHTNWNLEVRGMEIIR